MNIDADKVPLHIEKMVKVGIESGAVLSGTMLFVDRFAESIIVGLETKLPHVATIIINSKKDITLWTMIDWCRLRLRIRR